MVKPKYIVQQFREDNVYRVYNVRYWPLGLENAIWSGDNYQEALQIAKEANAKHKGIKPKAKPTLEQGVLL